MRPVFLASMRRFSYLGVVACVASGLVWQRSGAMVPMPHPDDGTVTDGIYTTKYFDLSYPLPSGWMKGMAGPGPSHSGYYVLSSLIPAGEQTGTILIAAQDMFFAANAFRDATTMAHEIGRAMSEIAGMTIDRQPSEATIAGRPFSRVDFSGVGLFRSTLITQIRCHLVSFNLTANNPDLLAMLVLSLDNLGRAGDRGAGDPDPVCIKNQAPTEHLLTRVDPPAIAPFVPIPVRIIIEASGSVKHVHAIRATADQRNAIETALGQWKFQPPEVDGRVAEIETGLLIEFTPVGAVKYLAGDRAQRF
jgi:hypothetical protein